jgi:hypothetical protein
MQSLILPFSVLYFLSHSFSHPLPVLIPLLSSIFSSRQGYAGFVAICTLMVILTTAIQRLLYSVKSIYSSLREVYVPSLVLLVLFSFVPFSGFMFDNISIRTRGLSVKWVLQQCSFFYWGCNVLLFDNIDVEGDVSDDDPTHDDRVRLVSGGDVDGGDGVVGGGGEVGDGSGSAEVLSGLERHLLNHYHIERVDATDAYTMLFVQIAIYTSAYVLIYYFFPWGAEASVRDRKNKAKRS